MAMAKRQLRESLRSEIDNLFKSPEQAESQFQRATKRRRPSSSKSVSQSPSAASEDDEPGKPKIGLNLTRLINSERIDCELFARTLHFSIFGSVLRKPRWMTVTNHRNILQTLLIRVNVEDDFFETTNLSFPSLFFDKKWIELDSDISDRNRFWTNIMNVQLTLQEQIRRKSDKMDKVFEKNGKHDRTHFVLSTTQMAERNFPFPGEENIVPTKQKYKQLSAFSPMFSLDCEMCETNQANRALTRISIVDEGENTLLDTLVKPDGFIIDYVTQYSGITAEMMEGVETTLKDVQRAIQSLLPPDAILVGHSLEYDLQAMKMTHPYCLDVGHVLNYTNDHESTRNSLKNLTELFLGERIQSAFGHCSYEDAWAAMRLAQLKIEKGIVFGNTSFGWKYTDYAKTNVSSVGKVRKLEVALAGCSDCSSPTVVGCSVKNCRCRLASGPVKCVSCLMLGDIEQGDFDWQESLQVDTDRPSTPIDTYLAKDKMKSVMLAMDRTDLDLPAQFSKKIHTRNPSSFPSHEAFIDDVAAGMLNDSAVLIEIEKSKILPLENANEETGELPDNAEALNEKLEKLVAATTKNALIMMIFSSAKKNILYVRIK